MMRHISRVPFRAFLRSSKSIPQSYRTQCTASTTSEIPNAKRLMEDPTNKHLRDEYHNAAGEVIFEHDPNKPLSDEDWRRFEAAFGLNEPIPEDKIRKWEAMVSEEPLQEDLPLGSGSIIMGPSDHQKNEARKREATSEDKVTKRRRPRRETLEHGLRQPLHRRPGYEKRVASMEAEMARVVTEVLIERGSDWYSAGADIERVLLSPNLHNLTIYYTVEEGTEDMDRKKWRRLNKQMAARVHKEIFERMHVRYVPKVFFEKLREDTKTSRERALDAAFAQIAVERVANSTKPA